MFDPVDLKYVFRETAANESFTLKTKLSSSNSEWSDSSPIERERERERENVFRSMNVVSVTRWLGYFLIYFSFSTMRICRTAFKIGQSKLQTLANTIWTFSKCPNFLNVGVKWRNFAESGHSECGSSTYGKPFGRRIHSIFELFSGWGLVRSLPCHSSN